MSLISDASAVVQPLEVPSAPGSFGVASDGSRFKVFYPLTLLFFTLALLAKPMVVTLPFVLLLLDYWRSLFLVNPLSS